ncbi:MAG TPA: ATP-dependent RecD-like DNA helicase [Ktedonobacterales bacterium]|nr:ATP-dependent RecD-like DNA helicase [Ktedonobacterales bacterium]
MLAQSSMHNPSPSVPDAQSASPLKIIAGVVERITFQNEENGYTVARFLPDPIHRTASAASSGRRSSRSRPHGEEHLVTIVGTLIGVVAGEALELKGFWQQHAQHGWQFTVRDYRSILPATAQGIRKYLGSGLIKGIGPKTADKIVSTFELETLAILEETPQRLIEVPGLGKRKVEMIIAAWEEQKAIKEVMLCLQELSVSTSLAVRIYKQYQDAAVTIVKNEPYRLARDVWGIGFKTADKIAQSLGYTLDHPERIKAGAFFALSEAADNDGHTYLPLPELARKAADLLGVTPPQVEQAITDLALEGGIQLESWGTEIDSTADGAAPADEIGVYLRPFYAAEQGIARNLWRLATCPPERRNLAELRQINFPVMFEYLATRANIALAERQQQGIIMALTNPVSVLTGGPGTGKTTSLRALIRVLTLKNKRVILAAPTGRAAKRLSEATGIEAKTLHRLLQLRPGSQSLYNRDNPLPADMLIIDEVSMLDTLLMNSLLKGVATGTSVLFVGDADQLPSVGAGNVLADVISSGVVPVTRLEHIFRQGAGSAIATNARRINQGQMPLTGPEMRDFFFFTQDDAAAARDTVVDLVARRIPARFGFRPEEIQVLSPMHRGACGVAALNEQLQTALNPSAPGKEQKQYGGTLFRVGDKVLQLRNNYDKEVFNGDGGVITAIASEDQTMTVRLDDGRKVTYEFGELDELALAYAVSIHKAQGSEYPVCVIPLVMEQYMLLERQLLYTAITRARQLAVLVGSRKALAIAVKNGPPQLTQAHEEHQPAAPRHRSSRYTALSIRLRQISQNGK